jgi:uncharacterized protein
MTITHDNHRFMFVQDGHEAHLDYTLAATVMTITHTLVPEALGGRGIAGQLTQAAFDHARLHNFKIIPQCSYAAAWAQRHVDMQDILA